MLSVILTLIDCQQMPHSSNIEVSRKNLTIHTLLFDNVFLFDHFPSRPGGRHPGSRAAPASSASRIPAIAETEPAEALTPGWLSPKQYSTFVKFDHLYNKQSANRESKRRLPIKNFIGSKCFPDNDALRIAEIIFIQKNL